MNQLLKTCSVCEQTKPVTQFYRRSNRRGRDKKCHDCRRQRARERRHEKWPNGKPLRTPKQKRLRWERDLQKKYGLTSHQYNSIYTKQEGRCLICKTFPEKLTVDHCHKTGQVRGLLCGQCNALLGNAKDNPKILKRAIRYLSAYAGSD